MSALCATRPAEWWDTGDDGNRLALALCRVCPNVVPCAAGDRKPRGVVRAGVVYGDAGELPLCGCGYPFLARCRRCDPAWPKWWRGPYDHERYLVRKAKRRLSTAPPDRETGCGDVEQRVPERWVA